MRHPDTIQRLTRYAFVASLLLLIMTGTVWGYRLFLQHQTQKVPQPSDYAIGGFPLSGNSAPDIHLIDQFGRPATLSSLRGHEVVLSFIDARCTSLCPLTAEILYQAKTQLGPSAAGRIVLVAVNANPGATSIPEVQAWSIKHGMLHQWIFLTGTAKQLESVYHLYNVYDQVDASGAAVHDPVMFIIDADGHERLSYETLSSNNEADLKSEIAGLKAGMQQWLPRSSS